MTQWKGKRAMCLFRRIQRLSKFGTLNLSGQVILCKWNKWLREASVLIQLSEIHTTRNCSEQQLTKILRFLTLVLKARASHLQPTRTKYLTWLLIRMLCIYLPLVEQTVPLDFGTCENPADASCSWRTIHKVIG